MDNPTHEQNSNAPGSCQVRPSDIAKRYMILGVQSWGQSLDVRREATEAYLNAAGAGIDRAGYQWLAGVMANLRFGKVEDEIEQLTAVLIAKAEGRTP